MFTSLFIVFTFSSCKQKTESSKSIAVFVPGIIDDSPIYAKLVQGVKAAVDEYNLDIETNNSFDNSLSPNEQNEKNDLFKKVELFIFEAGTNQSEWLGQLTSLCASQKYDVIFSSNPSLPELARPLTEQFPLQKFIFLDAYCNDNPNIATANYKQDEAAFLTGYICALMSKSKKIGLIAAQEYPVMNNIILPEFIRGAQLVEQNTVVDFRIVGNWWDAKKAAELCDSMALSGVDAILPICGGASQGVIASAKEHNVYLSWFDSNSYASAPGLVISCVVNLQEELAYEMTMDFLNEKIKWQTAISFGIKDGYIKFIDDDDLYLTTVPLDVRQKVQLQIEKIIGQ